MELPDTVMICQTTELPILLPVVPEFIYQTFGKEAWAAFIENFGEPWVIGDYPFGAEQSFKDELRAAVNAIARSSRGIKPAGSEINIHETSRGTGDHEKFKQDSDRAISVAILGHENAVSTGQGLQVGENLTQYKVRFDIAIDDCYFIDQYMQNLVINYCDRNFGDGKYPVFEMDKTEAVNVAEMLEVVDLAYRHGLEIVPENYDKLGLILAENQETVKKPDSLLNY